MLEIFSSYRRVTALYLRQFSSAYPFFPIGHKFFQYLVPDPDASHATEDGYRMASMSGRLAALFHVLAVIPFRQAMCFCNYSADAIQINESLNSTGIPTVYSWWVNCSYFR